MTSEESGSGKGRSRRLVFVSHSSRDTWVARQIAKEIEQRGAHAFLDASAIDVGDDFIEEIRTNLWRADELVVLWTPPAVGRVFITTEVASAWLRGVPIVQILYGVTASELVANPDFPPFLRSLHMVQIDDLDFYLDQLRRRIEAGEATQEGSV